MGTVRINVQHVIEVLTTTGKKGGKRPFIDGRSVEDLREVLKAGKWEIQIK